jgi:5-methylcytosine-specific restriction endonuclease McrA
MTWAGKDAAKWAPLVVATYGPVCWLCGGAIDMDAPRRSALGLTIDHVVPRSHGGQDSIENLRPAHYHCNVKRGARPPHRPARPASVAAGWPGLTG